MEADIRILVLEDDAVMRETLREALEEEGYQVEAVASGVKAIEQARGSAFDLIVADVRMEGIDGLDTIEQVRDIAPGIRSLVVTGYCNEADTIRALKLGVGDYIQKPFQLQDFLDSVRRQVLQKKVDSERQADRQAFARALRLALEARARLYDLEVGGCYPKVEGLQKLGPWARALAQESGLSDEECLRVEILAYLRGLESQQPDFSLEGLEDSLDENTRAALGQLRHASPELVQAQLAAAILAFGALEEADAESLLESAIPPLWVESLQRLESEGPNQTQPRRGGQSGSRRRGLLALGQALEGRGDGDGAATAYQAVIKESEEGAETIEARLGLARLARQSGQRLEALEEARRAVESAARQGPNSLALTQVEAAFLAFEQDRQWAVDQLTRARAGFEKFGQAAGLAKVDLALWVARGDGQAAPGEALRRLTLPLNSDELALCARWLAPQLLERCPDQSEAEQALFQIARLFPGELQRMLHRRQLSAGARANLVPVLARAGGAAAAGLLELLSQDGDPDVLAALQRHKPGAESGLPLIRLYTLGAFAIYRGEERIPDKTWRRKKNRLFLARLAAAPGAVPEDVLIEEFWPGDPDKGRQNIYSATSVARKCLAPSDGERLEVVDRSGLGLSLSTQIPLWHDLSEVQGEFEQARRCQDADRVQESYPHLKRVHKLYRGPYLEGCFMDWAVDIRRNLEHLLLQTFGRLCGWLEEQRRGDELGEFSRWMLEVDPCSQQAHVSLMRSLLLEERPEEAVRHFERARLTLARELAMEPSIELLREHQRALLSLD
ncbi:MAG: response regulator [Vulcanimicrobiota bacterium]